MGVNKPTKTALGRAKRSVDSWSRRIICHVTKVSSPPTTTILASTATEKLRVLRSVSKQPRMRGSIPLCGFASATARHQALARSSRMLGPWPLRTNPRQKPVREGSHTVAGLPDRQAGRQRKAKPPASAGMRPHCDSTKPVCATASSIRRKPERLL